MTKPNSFALKRLVFYRRAAKITPPGRQGAGLLQKTFVLHDFSYQQSNTSKRHKGGDAL
jgi:hypothetical protein